MPGKPLVAIVGRPNVGKSSLFNALLRQRAAIVSEVAGTTRDRVFSEIEHAGRHLLLVDTGGIVEAPESDMQANITAQADEAITDADAVLFVADIVEGVTPDDAEVARRLRRARKPVVLVANKADSERQEMLAADLYTLGLGEPVAVSALHRRGIDDVLDAVLRLLPPPSESEAEPAPELPHFALVGRPNVGKSALVNAILGMERSIVSEVAGTTRDALDTLYTFEGKDVVLIDTAGMRRRGHVETGIETYSVLRAARAIERSDVAIVVLDTMEMVTAQDLHIAGQVMASFKGVVVAINKMDLVEATPDEMKVTKAQVLERLKFMDHVPVVCTSAVNGTGVRQLVRTAFAVHERRAQWVDPDDLSQAMFNAISKHLPPRGVKIYRIEQTAIRPPTFVFAVNKPDAVHFSYERYIENSLREHFNFDGTHLRIEFRGRGKIHVVGQQRVAKQGPTRPRAPENAPPPAAAHRREGRLTPPRGRGNR
ncbi:MAG: ribosome biogenesis GTPase Der [SAR202 cluster bacterium]|nr:ribosome biogenesis GTPase Der [SAR202 cluster bacterium]